MSEFWEKVSKTNTCWVWTACKNTKGYGEFRVKGKLWIAHRFSYLLHYGFLDSKLVVMHLCDNPSCVNPVHLKQGTVEENNYDRDKKGRFKKMQGEANGNSKLNAISVANIRQLKKFENYSCAKLAKLYNVDKSLISLIVNNKIWKHV